MADVVMTAAFVVFLWAVVGLIFPGRAGIPSRAAAVGVWVISVILLVIGTSMLPDDPDRTTSTTPNEQSDSPQPGAQPVSVPSAQPEAAAQWSMINFVDEFGERTDRGAASAAVNSIRPMSFPYGDTEARIFVDCDRAWLRFSETPNLDGGNIEDGYTRYSVAVRVDGNDAGRWPVNQSWGDNDLRFTNNSQVISALSSGSTIAIAVSWYEQDSAAFSWALNGSSTMIQDSCD